MKKTGQFFGDTFEQLKEFGQSTAKKTGQALSQTFSPLRLIENTIFPSSEKMPENSTKKKGGKKPYTPLDFEKLQKKYQEEDKVKLEQARQRLFQLVKKGEEAAIQEGKKKEEEKKQKEMAEKEKKTEEERKKEKEQQQEAPQGKIRRSIFSPKRIAQKQHFETKPSRGKN